MKKTGKKYLALLIGAGILVFLGIFIQFSVAEFLSAIPEFFRFLFMDFLPPSLSQWKEYVQPVLDTFYFSVIATFVSSVISVILAFLAAGRITALVPLKYLIKFIASVIRNIPVLVWASILVLIFGIGTIPGVMSLIIFDIGFLIRSYSESLEEMEVNYQEALKAQGISSLVRIVRGDLPMFLPSFYSWTLFIFEINIRASAILGIVGAGGLGVQLKEATGMFRYHEAAAIIIVMVVMILGVDFLTNKVKEALV